MNSYIRVKFTYLTSLHVRKWRLTMMQLWVPRLLWFGGRLQIPSTESLTGKFICTDSSSIMKSPLLTPKKLMLVLYLKEKAAVQASQHPLSQVICSRIISFSRNILLRGVWRRSQNICRRICLDTFQVAQESRTKFVICLTCCHVQFYTHS